MRITCRVNTKFLCLFRDPKVPNVADASTTGENIWALQ